MSKSQSKKEVTQNQFMRVIQRMGYLAKRINNEEDAEEEFSTLLFELGILGGQLGLGDILEGEEHE